MTVRRALALVLALTGCGEVAQMSEVSEVSESTCFGDGGVCEEEVASAEEELTGRFGSVFRPGVTVPPVVSLDVGGASGCVSGALDPADPLQRPIVSFQASGVSRLARVELCRDGDCFWSENISEATYRRAGWTSDPEPVLFTPTLPLERIVYTARATDRGGRTGTVNRTVKVGPRTELELLDTLQVRGPRTGAGVRHFRVHWRGVNVERVCLGPSRAGVVLDTVCQNLPASDRWGPVERVTYFSIWIDAASAARLFEESAEPPPIVVQAASARLEGCEGISPIVQRYLDWRTDMTVGTPMETPMPPPDEPMPPPGDSGSWFPQCQWTCDTTSPSGWIRTNSARTPLPGDCPTPYQYEICRYDDRPEGAMLSVCSSESTPLGWSTVSFSSSVDRCAGTTTTNNVKLIRRLD